VQPDQARDERERVAEEFDERRAEIERVAGTV